MGAESGVGSHCEPAGAKRAEAARSSARHGGRRRARAASAGLRAPRTRDECDCAPERGRYRSSFATRAASAGALSGRARSGRNCKGRARENGGRRLAARTRAASAQLRAMRT
ncbi:hypothetical protein BURPS668_A2800 [Burkholderia pseudomallei 668]|nr:hypothetical protein BURPS668_A2800 [Burkholderia pseudomallei 668]